MAEPLDCPVCGCEFTPSEPGQRYCSPWCEQHAKSEEGDEPKP